MGTEAALPYSLETDPVRHRFYPLGIWDASWGLALDTGTTTFWREIVNWAKVHLPDASNTYRAEFYILDTAFAILYEYAVIRHGDWEGVRVVFPPTGEISKRKPYIYLLDELPPSHLLHIPRVIGEVTIDN